ncbi:MAG TPA: hypothetical protein VK631_23410 [Solirubrobacteraceae bacterium]|nr:hypothetical protein [Solirubrobacteraceae bacterium]
MAVLVIATPRPDTAVTIRGTLLRGRADAALHAFVHPVGGGAYRRARCFARSRTRRSGGG